MAIENPIEFFKSPYFFGVLRDTKKQNYKSSQHDVRHVIMEPYVQTLRTAAVCFQSPKFLANRGCDLGDRIPDSGWSIS